MSNTTNPGHAGGWMPGGMRAVTAPHLDWATADPHPWMDEAKCRTFVHHRSTGEGVDWFDLHPITAAKICDECPVRAACAERVLMLIANQHTPRIGVWAGKRFGKDAKDGEAA